MEAFAGEYSKAMKYTRTFTGITKKADSKVTMEAIYMQETRNWKRNGNKFLELRRRQLNFRQIKIIYSIHV